MKRTNNKRRTKTHALPGVSRHSGYTRSSLGFEALEIREVLTGIVNVQIFPPNGVAGNLTLVGDGSNNNVVMSQTLNTNEFLITAPASEPGQPTLFQLNGAGQTFTQLTVNNIFGDIAVNLGGGNTTFVVNGTGAPGGLTSLPHNLTITNANGSHVNTLDAVLVNNNFTVNRVNNTNGYAELQILDKSIVTGNTVVTNTIAASNGDTKTVVDNSWLQGGTGQALVLTNGDGFNWTTFSGNAQFGNGNFIGPQPIVSIVNGNGGSLTTMTGSSQTAGFGTTTVYGGLSVSNGTAPQGHLNIVSFNRVNVLGATLVANADSNTQTLVNLSTLGSQLITNPPGTGGNLAVENNAGFDTFVMTGSTLPWGLLINNDVGNSNASNWGSSTQISATSAIGTRLLIGPIPQQTPPNFAAGFALPAGVAFEFLGDNGADINNVNGTTFGGSVIYNLFNGNNTLAMTAVTSLPALYVFSGNGNDKVTLDNIAISVLINMSLGAGSDTLTVANMNFATQWPSNLLGSVIIDGGSGVDTLVFTNDTGVMNGAISGFEL